MKKIVSMIIIISLIVSFIGVKANNFTHNSDVKSLLLMEASSGTIIFEKNSHQSLPPASVTKIMTMLLICEAIEKNEITLETKIVASERAKSMGGSTIFLDTNEVMSLDDLLKGIAVASANDACVAVAEHMCGSVEGFVSKMNSRASELGMKDTNFVNCNGLDEENHHTSAYDIAIMSRELLRHKIIEKYTTIWIDSLRNGKFQLANTNKLIRFYKGANGLKTGSTNKAGCCISATAKRDGMQLIAVVMGASDSKSRFNVASELLNYGFANFTVNNFGEKGADIREVKVLYGNQDALLAITKDEKKVLVKKEDKKNIKTHFNIPETIKAPVKKGDIIGEMIVTLNGETLCKTDIISDRNIKKKNSINYFIRLLKGMLLS